MPYTESQTFDITELSQLSNIANTLVKDTHNATTWVYLNGDLGAGKTTFSQLFIAAAGYQGRVTSPTYAIMQDYPTPTLHVIHCDLYRLADPEELDELGIIEMAEENNSTVLVEWPRKGLGVLPEADIILDFSLSAHYQRSLTITKVSPA